jgi:hypothetical protein
MLKIKTNLSSQQQYQDEHWFYKSIATYAWKKIIIIAPE